MKSTQTIKQLNISSYLFNSWFSESKQFRNRGPITVGQGIIESLFRTGRLSKGCFALVGWSMMRRRTRRRRWRWRWRRRAQWSMWREKEEAFSENFGRLVMGSFPNGEWRSDWNLSEESHVCYRQYGKEEGRKGQFGIWFESVWLL